MRDLIASMFKAQAPQPLHRGGPGKRNICPELGRHYRVPDPKTQRCKALPVTATKAEREALHAAKMAHKGYRRA